MSEANNPWTILSEEEKYSNPWIKITEFDVLNPAGNKGIYGVVHFKNYAIGIVPLDENLNTYLVGQYRFPLNEYSWEIPEGGCLLGEEKLDGAQRELLEETGLKAKHWQRILDMHLSNSVCDEVATIYVATGLSQHEAIPEETEQLVIKKLPFDEVYDMVKKGEITDAMSVAAILQTKLLLLSGELQAHYHSVE
ncbi:MAG: NUDIX hydrolase [Bacteroidota bacterium]|nr:NUDIX hydrolase [Bacteroidota bacterium]